MKFFLAWDTHETNIFEHFLREKSYTLATPALQKGVGLSRAKEVLTIGDLRLFKRKWEGKGWRGSKDWIPAAILPLYFWLLPNFLLSKE